MLYDITIPANLKRCGIETKLVIAGSTEEIAHVQTVKAIQDALVKALSWNNVLINDKSTSMQKIVKEEGVTQRYIAQIVKLAYLAPDIMLNIRKGQIPVNLTLGHLKKGFPLSWEQQRKTLQFSTSWHQTELAK